MMIFLLQYKANFGLFSKGKVIKIKKLLKSSLRKPHFNFTSKNGSFKYLQSEDLKEILRPFIILKIF